MKKERRLLCPFFFSGMILHMNRIIVAFLFYEYILTTLINQAERIVVLTGAGMSTESGIPDFRSAGGIWTEDTSRMEAMSREYFERRPRGIRLITSAHFHLKELFEFRPEFTRTAFKVFPAHRFHVFGGS
jgi:NAD-dependent SIR2 family protein deacetylase